MVNGVWEVEKGGERNINESVHVHFDKILPRGSSSAAPLTSSAADDGNVVAKNSPMREKFTRMVLWMPSFISFFEMPSIMNLASLLVVGEEGIVVVAVHVEGIQRRQGRSGVDITN